MSGLQLAKQEIQVMREFFLNVIGLIPSFNITDPKILPYGLKPHTRSVSWIAEQVIVQQAKYNQKKLGATDVHFDLPDTCLHDCIVSLGDKKYHVNIKVTNTATRNNKNDISAVEKLYMHYRADRNYRLIYIVFPLSFNNTLITFERDKVHAFSPQFLPIYVNPRNHKIQAYYDAKPEFRSRSKFLSLLEEKSTSIDLVGRS